MKIELLHDYRGRRTNERRIPAGVYEADDAALFGLAAYLIENGHAVEVGSSITSAEAKELRDHPGVDPATEGVDVPSEDLAPDERLEDITSAEAKELREHPGIDPVTEDAPPIPAKSVKGQAASKTVSKRR